LMCRIVTRPEIRAANLPAVVLTKAGYITSAFAGHPLMIISVVPAKKERKFIDYSEFRIKIFRFNLVTQLYTQSAVKEW
jgi:hypothetical protein